MEMTVERGSIHQFETVGQFQMKCVKGSCVLSGSELTPAPAAQSGARQSSKASLIYLDPNV